MENDKVNDKESVKLPNQCWGRASVGKVTNERFTLILENFSNCLIKSMNRRIPVKCN